MDDAILTDEHGRPISRPEKPPEGASIDERMAYVRALHAYNDRATDVANRAFDATFRRAVRGE